MIAATVTRWTRHECNRHHRNARAFIRCTIRRLAWVNGHGTYAVVAWCQRPTVTLWADLDAAGEALEQVDATGCGGRCRRRHQLVHVDLEAVAP